MFSASKVMLNYNSVQTAVGRVTALANFSPVAEKNIAIDSAGNVFFNYTTANTIYLFLIATNGTVTYGRQITGAVRSNAYCATVNETATGGRTYIHAGTVGVSNTFDEVIQMSATGTLSSVQGVYYGTSTTIFFNSIVGAYVDTTGSLEIYMGLSSNTSTKFILSGTSNPSSTAIVPSTAKNIVYGGTSFTINRMTYDSANSYVVLAGSSVAGSVTSGLILIGSGAGYGTYKAIGYNDGAANGNVTSFAYAAVDKFNTSRLYCVGTVYQQSTTSYRPFICRVDHTASPMTNNWYKVFSVGSFAFTTFLGSLDTDSSGNVYAFGALNFNVNASLVKFDSNGNILYSRDFTIPNANARSVKVVGSTVYLVFTTTTATAQTIVIQMPTDGTYSNAIINGVRIQVDPGTYTVASVTMTVTNPTFTTNTTITPTAYTTAVTRTNNTLSPTSSTLLTY